MSQMQSISYSVLGFGLGLTFGVLFAPRSGADLRREMRGKAQDGRDYLKSKILQAGEYVEDNKRKLTSETNRLINAVEAGKVSYRQGGTNAAAAR